MSATGPSGTVPGRGVPAADETDEQKKKRALSPCEVVWQKLIKFCTATMCSFSKLCTEILKFTAQALWMTRVSFERSSSSLFVPKPKSDLLRSDGTATTFCSCSFVG